MEKERCFYRNEEITSSVCVCVCVGVVIGQSARHAKEPQTKAKATICPAFVDTLNAQIGI